MRVFSTILAIVIVSSILAETAQATEIPEVEGVFGLNQITNQTSLSVWVPLEEDAVVTGVRWYQNDGNTRFPEILAQAGLLEWPGNVSNAVSMASDVEGSTSAWSELTFSQPITADCAGLYLYFRLPEGAAFLHEGIGGGFGLGYSEGNGVRNSWFTGNNEDWNPMETSFKMAVEPIWESNKAIVDVLVLRLQDGSSSSEPIDESQILKPLVASLSTYPNPFNPRAKIKFVVPNSGVVDLRVYDLRGRLISVLVAEHLERGEHILSWDGRDQSGMKVSSGVYFARLKANSVSLNRRLVLLK